MKKALLVLLTSGVLLGSGGCLNWRWWEGAAWFGKNVTDILVNTGILAA